jgi:hypothetical protein
MGAAGGIIGAAGSIASSAIQASAQKKIMQMQLDAIKKQREFVYNELNPTKINAQASAADIQRAQERLRLQGKIDPAALAARYAGEAKVLEGIEGLGKADSDKLAAQAAQEAMAQTGEFEAVKARMIDQALAELDAGATIPKDVQAELVKAGLERSGAVSGAATGQGFGGNILRKLIGTEALKLQADRQARAQALSTTASNLEQARANILGNLFPRLQQQQMENIKAAAGGVNLSEAIKPDVGLSGTDVANIWMARVGATNQLASQATNAQAAAMGNIANAWQSGISGAATGIGNAITPNPYASLMEQMVKNQNAAGSGTGGLINWSNPSEANLGYSLGY